MVTSMRRICHVHWPNNNTKKEWRGEHIKIDEGHGVFFNFYVVLDDELHPDLIRDLGHLYEA